MALRKVSPVVLLLTMAACTKSAPPTPPGATAIDWNLHQSDRASIRNAKLSDQASKEIPFSAQLPQGAKVQLKLTVELATVTFVEDGKESTHTAPATLRAEVVDSGNYTLGPATCNGPHYQLAPPGAAPAAMVLMCTVKAKTATVDGLFTVTVYGDGRVEN